MVLRCYARPRAAAVREQRDRPAGRCTEIGWTLSTQDAKFASSRVSEGRDGKDCTEAGLVTAGSVVGAVGRILLASVAVKDLAALTIVFARVAFAAASLTLVMWARGTRFPLGVAEWQPFFVMAVLNNVIPFSLIVIGQTMIASGLASVLNATTPLLAVLVMAALWGL